MAYDEELAQRVRKLLHLKRVAFEEKRMMGGRCVMVDGKMCVGVEKNRLMARIDPEDYPSVLKRKGCRPMDFTGRPLKGFIFVSKDGISTDRQLTYWVELALAYNPKAKASAKANKTTSIPATSEPGSNGWGSWSRSGQ